MSAPLCAPVMVLGMHRSGTSAVSRLLHNWTDQDHADLLPANTFNQTGYWEPKPVVDLNNQFLLEIDHHWADPSPIDWRDDMLDARAQRAAEVLEATFGNRSHPILKDPRFSLTFPIWTRALEMLGTSPICVLVYRNPNSVLASLSDRNGLTRCHSNALWLTYMLAAEFETRAFRRVIVCFEDLVDRTGGALEKLAACLGESSDLARLEDVANRVIDPKLYHHHAHAAPEMPEDQLGQNVAELHRTLEKGDGALQSKHIDEVRKSWQNYWADSANAQLGAQYAGRLPEWHMVRSKKAVKNGETDLAVTFARSAVDVAPNHPGPRMQLARSLFATGHYAEALGEVDTAIALDVSLENTHVFRARILLKLERLSDALEEIECALAFEPVAASTYAIQATIQEKSGNLVAARQNMAKAVQLSQDGSRYSGGLARIDRKLAETADPAEKDREPGNSQQPAERARIAAMRGDIRGALDILLPLLSAPDCDAKLVEFAVRLLDKSGQINRLLTVVAQLPERIQLGPHSQFLVARAHAIAGQWDVAERLRDQAAAAIQQNTPPPFGLGLQIAVAAWEESENAGARGGAADLELNTTTAFARQPIKNMPPPSCDLSVMMPIYGVKDIAWLVRAIGSVLHQVFLPPETEIVILNDGETDDAILQGLAKRDPRIRVINNATRKGITGNHIACLTEAAGRYVHILHQDDFLHPQFFKSLIPALDADDRLGMAFCPTRVIDATDLHKRTSPILLDSAGVLERAVEHFAHSPIALFPSIILRRSVCESIGGFSPDLKYAFDWEFWQSVSHAGAVWFDPNPLATRTNHALSASNSYSHEERIGETLAVASAGLRQLPQDVRSKMARHVLFRVLESSKWQVAGSTQTNRQVEAEAG